MKNEGGWKPSKFVRTKEGRLVPNRDRVPPHSWVAAACGAKFYDRYITQYATGDVLDLGCGEAPLYAVYRSLVRSVTCIDWEASSHSTPHADRLHDLNVPLECEAQFDTVVASDVLEHLHNPRALFQTSAGALRKGGVLVLGTPFLYWLHEEPYDFLRHTVFSLRNLCSAVGLEVLHLEPIGGAPEVLVDLVHKCFATRPAVIRLSVPITTWLLGISYIRRISEASASKMPLGYILVARK